jgi:hypothetical protein
MNMEQRKIEYQIGGNAEQLKAAVDAAEKELKRLRKEAEKAGVDTGKKGILESLKNAFGGRSDLKDVTEILVGGGAVAGLSLAGRVLNDMTGKAIELRDAFSDGSKSAGEVADELIRSLPVLGNIFSAGQNIRELFTGERAEIARINADAAVITASIDAQAASWKKNVDAAARLAEIVERLRGSGDPFGGANKTAVEIINSRIAEIQAEAKGDDAKKLQQQINDARRQLNDAMERARKEFEDRKRQSLESPEAYLKSREGQTEATRVIEHNEDVRAARSRLAPLESQQRVAAADRARRLAEIESKGAEAIAGIQDAAYIAAILAEREYNEKLLKDEKEYNDKKLSEVNRGIEADRRAYRERQRLAAENARTLEQDMRNRRRTETEAAVDRLRTRRDQLRDEQDEARHHHHDDNLAKFVGYQDVSTSVTGQAAIAAERTGLEAMSRIAKAIEDRNKKDDERDRVIKNIDRTIQSLTKGGLT